MLSEIRAETGEIIRELLDLADLEAGDLFVVGCSTSEVAGERIGKAGSLEIAEAIFEGIYPALAAGGLYLAAQCCEHLNRALVVERELARREGLAIVSAVPKPTAGGSFAAMAWNRLERPVLVESVWAKAGIDIGGTLIGMQLMPVAVPLRLSRSAIGRAGILCAKTRPKYVGGPRTEYA